MYGPKRPFLLRYGSRDTRRIDFPRVDGLSTDPRVLGRHSYFGIRTVIRITLLQRFLNLYS